MDSQARQTYIHSALTHAIIIELLKDTLENKLDSDVAASVHLKLATISLSKFTTFCCNEHSAIATVAYPALIRLPHNQNDL